MIDLVISALTYLAWVAAILAGLVIVVMVAFAAMCCIPQSKLCHGCMSSVRWYHRKSKTETSFHLKCYSAWETGYDQGVSFGIKSQSYYEKAKSAKADSAMAGLSQLDWSPKLKSFEISFGEFEGLRQKSAELLANIDREWEQFCRRIEMPEAE